MDLELEGKTALVLGGGKGLGAAIANELQTEGVITAVVSRSKPERPNVNWIMGDLSDQGSASQIFRAAETQLGHVDILVCNSGGPPIGTAASTALSQFDAQMSALFRSQAELTQRVLPSMRSNSFGRVISVGSTSITEPIPGLVISNSFRSALAAWLKTLSREVASDGITVNTVAPGRIRTERLMQLQHDRAKSAGRPMEAEKQEAENTIPARRFGDPKEFASLAAFLASPRAGYITGECIRVDGGMSRGL